MKIAILSESSADDAALRILVDGTLGISTEAVSIPLRTRGWPAVRTVLPTVIKYLHYRTDAAGLVIVADSNHSAFGPNNTHSRLLELQQRVESVLASLTPVPARPAFRVAVGIACPAIEAWLLSSQRANVNEATWQRGLVTREHPYSKLDLKRYLYGVERPSLSLETEKMIEAANMLRTQLNTLETQFPIGFGSMAEELRHWRPSCA